MYEKSLKILGLSGNFDRMDLEVAYNKAKQKTLKNVSDTCDVKIIDDAYNYVLEDMLNKEELNASISSIPKTKKTDIGIINLVKALEYTYEDDGRLDKELRNYDANFEDLDNAIHYFKLVNMRETLEKLKIRNIN